MNSNQFQTFLLLKQDHVFTDHIFTFRYYDLTVADLISLFLRDHSIKVPLAICLISNKSYSMQTLRSFVPSLYKIVTHTNINL